MTPEWSLDLTERYLLLCEGQAVFTTQDKYALAPYLWGRILRRGPAGAWRYIVLDYEVPYLVDTDDLDAFVARLPEVPQRQEPPHGNNNAWLCPTCGAPLED